MRKKKVQYNDGWCFAKVNGRLAEIYFKNPHGIWAHCYIKRNEFGKREQKIIDDDIKAYRFTYRNGYYFDQIRGIKQKAPGFRKVFPALRTRKRLKSAE